MSLKNYSEIVTDTVNKLSVQDSYNGLCHQQKDDEPFPSSEILSEVVGITRSILFPGFFGKSIINTNTISYHLGVSIERLYELLYTQILAGMCFGDFCEQNDRCLNTMREEAKMKTERFIEFLPELRSLLALDVKAAFNNDPAAHSIRLQNTGGLSILVEGCAQIHTLKKDGSSRVLQKRKRFFIEP